jgi:hypothetical protein
MEEHEDLPQELLGMCFIDFYSLGTQGYASILSLSEKHRPQLSITLDLLE